MDYDFDREKKFSYKELNLKEKIEHIVEFISGIWQIPPFAEGNTRTVAVFTIKYLKTICKLDRINSADTEFYNTCEKILCFVNNAENMFVI